ncbi:hypothetical protein Dimus_018555 [Dionaea muscipula]
MKLLAQYSGSPITMIPTPTGQGITEHPLITGEEMPIERELPIVPYVEPQLEQEAEKESVPNLQVENQAREDIRMLAPALNAHTESDLQALTNQAGIQLSAPTTSTEKNDVPRVSDAQEDPNKEIQLDKILLS